MPATPIATQSVAGPYPSLPVGAGSLDLTFTAADTVNGNLFVVDLPLSTRPEGTIGSDILLVFNTDAAPHNFGIVGQPDASNRSVDLGGGLTPTYSVGAGVISAFTFSQIVGWANGSNQVTFKADSALVKFAIIKR